MRSLETHVAVLQLESMWSNHPDRFIPTPPLPIIVHNPSLQLLKATDTQGKRLNETVQRWRADIETTEWREEDVVWPESPLSGPIEIVGFVKPEEGPIEIWAAQTLASMANAECARRN